MGHHADKYAIPLSLHAVKLSDNEQVGFMVDLREKKLEEIRNQLISEVNSQIVKARDLESGLCKISKTIQDRLGAAFCHFILKDDVTNHFNLIGSHKQSQSSNITKNDIDFLENNDICIQDKDHLNVYQSLFDIQEELIYMEIHALRNGKSDLCFISLGISVNMEISPYLDLGQQRKSLGLVTYVKDEITELILRENFHHQLESDKALLQALFTNAAKLGSHESSNSILNEAANSLKMTLKADSVCFILMDRQGNILQIANKGDDWPSNSIRSSGMTRLIREKGDAIIIPDTTDSSDDYNPILDKRGIKAAYGLPLEVLGQIIGAVWIHHKHPRKPRPEEMNALGLFLGQVIHIYHSQHRAELQSKILENLEHLEKTSEIKEVGQALVDTVMNILSFNEAWFGVYHMENASFVPDMIQSGGDPKILEFLKSRIDSAKDELGDQFISTTTRQESIFFQTDDENEWAIAMSGQ